MTAWLKQMRERLERFTALAIKHAGDDGGYMRCPVCEGEGELEAKAYDSQTHAAGLEAFGIGDSLEHAEQFIAHAPTDLAKLLRIVEVQREALDNGTYNGVRELLALMAEGEGNDARVYQRMAKDALTQVDQALKAADAIVKGEEK